MCQPSDEAGGRGEKRSALGLFDRTCYDVPRSERSDISAADAGVGVVTDEWSAPLTEGDAETVTAGRAGWSWAARLAASKSASPGHAVFGRVRCATAGRGLLPNRGGGSSEADASSVEGAGSSTGTRLLTSSTLRSFAATTDRNCAVDIGEDARDGGLGPLRLDGDAVRPG